MKRFAIMGALALASLWTGSASADEPDVATAPAAPAPPRYDLVRINAGPRFDYVRSGAFDAFASNDVLSQFSIDGTYPILTTGKLVLGAGLGWTVGGRSDTVRGSESSLVVHRVTVPLEGRYHIAPWLFAFGKVAPGAAAMIATVKDASSPNDLQKTGFAFAADASLGASVLLGPRADLGKRTPRFWLTPEVGYAFTTAATVGGSPDRAAADALGTDEPASLRTLALSGVFWRVSLAVTF